MHDELCIPLVYLLVDPFDSILRVADCINAQFD
jgi:hypothetical protein